MNCEFCNKVFVNTYVLENHKRTSKTCLKIQDEDTISNNEINCQYCELKLTTIYNLKRHEKSCQKKSEKEQEDCIKLLTKEIEKQKKINDEQRITIEEYKTRELEIYKKLYEQSQETIFLLNKSKNSSKNITTSDENISLLVIFEVSNIKDIFLKKFEMKHCKDGQKGVAKFIVENFLKDKNIYTVADRSRYIFNYMNEQKAIVKDKRAEYLINVFYKYIEEYSEKFKIIQTRKACDIETEDQDAFYDKIKKWYDDIIKIKDMSENTEFCKELVRLLYV